MQLIIPQGPEYFFLSYLMQMAVFHAFRFHEIHGPREGAKRLGTLLELKCAGSIVEHRITFDETLWFSDTNSYEKIMRIILAPLGTPEFWILELDFRKDMFSGVSVVDHNNKFPCNVFDVKFEAE